MSDEERLEERDECGSPTDMSLEAMRRRCERAHDMVSALCKPKGTEGSRRWTMSIPARPDHDPDLVIGDALRDLSHLLDRLEGESVAGIIVEEWRESDDEMRMEVAFDYRIPPEDYERRVTIYRHPTDTDTEESDG